MRLPIVDKYEPPVRLPDMQVQRIPGPSPARPVQRREDDGEAVFHLDLELLDGEEAARVLGVDAALAGELASAMRQLAERLPPVEVGDERPYHLVVALTSGTEQVEVTIDDPAVADAVRGASMESAGTLHVDHVESSDEDQQAPPTP
ncbi:MAG: hypothetical protein JWM86_437 [Thermoleophilia bacterium]|nr:hypothetical protein [Thermoleophilia bacterium]